MLKTFRDVENPTGRADGGIGGRRAPCTSPSHDGRQPKMVSLGSGGHVGGVEPSRRTPGEKRRAVASVMAGGRIVDVARTYGVSRRTVARWVEAERGIDALRDEEARLREEIRKHVKMPDEPLEIDEKDFYVRAFIKWATEEQPEVKRLEAENAKLRELVRDMWRTFMGGNTTAAQRAELRERMGELGVDA